MNFVPKFVQKFNSLCVMFLADLCRSLPDNALVLQAHEFCNALFALQPGNTDILSHCMTALQGAADFISARNTDIFSKASQVTSMITKNDAIEIYKQLSEEDRAIVWKYFSKIYAMGKKAAPGLVHESEFNFSNLVPKSPIHGLITTARAIMPTEQQIVVQSSSTAESSTEQSGLITTAFRQMALTLLSSIYDDCANDVDVQNLCTQMKSFIENSDDPDCTKLLAATQAFYPGDSGQQMVMGAEAAIREYGFPLIPGGGELAASVLDNAIHPDVLINAVMQFGTVYVTLTSMDNKSISKMEKLAQKFYEKVQSGEIQFGEDLDPMSMLSVLATSDLNEDIMALVQEM